MAGFFGLFDSSKPGPGVGKDEQLEKHGFFVFFDIYFRKFWSLLLINLLYFACLLPFIILTVAFLKIPSLSFLFLFLFLATMGPATAGFTYIMRNFAREEHAFLWSDYKDAIKKNWKQALAVSVINAVLALLLIISTQFYYDNSVKNSLFTIPFAVGLSCSLIFVFMQYYLYVMLITFNLKLKQLYKNAILFAFLGLLRNVLITVVVVIIGALALFLPLITIASAQFLFPLTIIIVPMLALSFLGLLINKNVWTLIKKYMIVPYNKEHDIKEKEKPAPIFEDFGREKPKK